MDILEKLVHSAKTKLGQEKLGKRKINCPDYRNFLENIADKKCPDCGQELKLFKADIKKQDNVGQVAYEFNCGHKHLEVCVSENIKIWESYKAKSRKGESKPYSVSLTKTEPGINPKSVDGVSNSWVADRGNNLWVHIIKDIKTGKILHEERMPLNEHKK